MSLTNLSPLIILLLFGVSSIHTFWGKGLPKFVWKISLVACIVNGFYIGLNLTSFPINIFISVVFSLSFIGITLLHRVARRNHET